MFLAETVVVDVDFEIAVVVLVETAVPVELECRLEAIWDFLVRFPVIW